MPAATYPRKSDRASTRGTIEKQKRKQRRTPPTAEKRRAKANWHKVLAEIREQEQREKEEMAFPIDFGEQLAVGIAQGLEGLLEPIAEATHQAAAAATAAATMRGGGPPRSKFRAKQPDKYDGRTDIAKWMEVFSDWCVIAKIDAKTAGLLLRSCLLKDSGGPEQAVTEFFRTHQDMWVEENYGEFLALLITKLKTDFSHPDPKAHYTRRMREVKQAEEESFQDYEKRKLEEVNAMARYGHVLPDKEAMFEILEGMQPELRKSAANKITGTETTLADVRKAAKEFESLNGVGAGDDNRRMKGLIKAMRKQKEINTSISESLKMLIQHQNQQARSPYNRGPSFPRNESRGGGDDRDNNGRRGGGGRPGREWRPRPEEAAVGALGQNDNDIDEDAARAAGEAFTADTATRTKRDTGHSNELKVAGEATSTLGQDPRFRPWATSTQGRGAAAEYRSLNMERPPAATHRPLGDVDWD